jgi:hypothetical protein
VRSGLLSHSRNMHSVAVEVEDFGSIMPPSPVWIAKRMWQGERHPQRERYEPDREALVQQREPDGCEAGLQFAGLLNCSMELESYTTGLNTSCLDPRARTRNEASARESQQGLV